MANTDHIVIKYDVQPPVIRCMHCGYEQVLSLPMSVDLLVSMSKVISKEHRNCKPK